MSVNLPSSPIGQAFLAGEVAVNAKQKFAQLHKATDGMQTAFVKTMVAQLQKETQKEFQGMPGADIYNDMNNQVIAEKLTATAHLGMSETLFKPMARLAYQQELGSAYANYSQQQSASAKDPTKTPTGSPSTILPGNSTEASTTTQS